MPSKNAFSRYRCGMGVAAWARVNQYQGSLSMTRRHVRLRGLALRPILRDARSEERHLARLEGWAMRFGRSNWYNRIVSPGGAVTKRTETHDYMEAPA